MEVASASSYSIKGGKLRKSHMEQLDIVLPPDTTDEVIRGAFAELVAPANPFQQISAVDKLLEASVACEESAVVCVSVLVSALLQLQPKVQLKNKILKCLPTISKKYPAKYREAVMQVLKKSLTSDGDAVCLVQGVVTLVEHEQILLPGTVTEQEAGGMSRVDMAELQSRLVRATLRAITLLSHASSRESSTLEVSSAFQQMQRLMKSITAVLQRNYYHWDHLGQCTDMQALVEAVFSVLHQPVCPLDLQINCGQLLVVLHRLRQPGNLHQLVEDIILGQGQYTDLGSVAKLAVINGVLCVMDGHNLYVKSKTGASPGVNILQAILSAASQSNDGHIALSATRVIHQWTLRTLQALQSGSSESREEDLDLFSPPMSGLLEYLWFTWDHYLDSVKHATKDTFINIIKFQQIMHPARSQQQLLNICQAFIKQLKLRKYRCSAVSCMVPAIGAATILALNPTLPCDLLHSLMDPAMASHAAELLEALFIQHHREVSQQTWENTWLNTFIDSFCSEMQVFGYELLFKKLLLTCPESLTAAVFKLIQYSKTHVSEKLCLLIMCVKIGRSSSHWNKVCESQKTYQNTVLWKNILPYPILELCLSHVDESVQLAVFSLLCDSPRSTELPETQEMAMILDFYNYSLTSQSPPFRQHLVRSSKKLLLRIKDGTLSLLRSNKNKNSPSTAAIITNISSFCESLFLLMVRNLNCGASMPRRGTALLILQLFHEHIANNSCGEVLNVTHLTQNERYVDTLLYMLHDSFESNKAVVLSLLSSCHGNLDSARKLDALVDSVFCLASSCRPPDSVTAAYLLNYLSTQPIAMTKLASQVDQGAKLREVICKCVTEALKKEVAVAQEDLLKAAASSPMYGLLLCLRIQLSDLSEVEVRERHHTWNFIIKDILQTCFTISNLVAPVVRNSSPEGHLPMDLNPESLDILKTTLRASLGYQQFQGEIELSADSRPDELVKAEAVSAQVLLLCAWRCIKEVSLILGNLTNQTLLPPSDCAVFCPQDVQDVMQYFQTQLQETKHRGAFEQSYVGFGKVVEQLWQCQDDTLHRLPQLWLNHVLASVQNDDGTKLCATRRSAGVPFIIQAVLSSEPSVRGAACLKSTMKHLLLLASESQYDGTDARIHAFNILRALYRDTRLGDLIIPYVSEGVKASIKGYKSTLWAERNSATLLFAALVTRMLGVKQTQDDLNRKNAMSALVFFRRYPELFDFLKEEVKCGSAGVVEGRLMPALFPTLLLLARLSPAPLEGRTSAVSLSSFTSAILQCASSSVLQLRVLASHALVPLVTPSQLGSITHQLCQQATRNHQNKLHGSLLCLTKLISNYIDSVPVSEVDLVMNNVMQISWAAMEDNPCLVTRSCAFELFTLLSSKECLGSKVESVLSNVCASALSVVQSSDHTLASKPWASICVKQAAACLINNISKVKCDYEDLIACLLNSSYYEVRLFILEYLATLQDLPPFVLKLLFRRIGGIEVDKMCLAQCYHILSRQIIGQQFHVDKETESQFSQLLCSITTSLKEEPSMELTAAMLQMTSAVVAYFLSKSATVDMGPSFTCWLAVFLTFSCSEHSAETRLLVAEGLTAVAPWVLAHPSLATTDGEVSLLEGLVTLLQDDSAQVRTQAAQAACHLLAQRSALPCLPCQPARVLPQICDVIGTTGEEVGPSLLLKLALKEEESQGFGLSQEEDRVFDKGEMNIYYESILIGRIAAQSLGHALQRQLSAPKFLKHYILPHLLTMTVLDTEKNTHLTLLELIHLLEEDISCVAEHLVGLQDHAVFCVRNVDVWLVRLGRRSALWRTLMHHHRVQSSVVGAVVNSLQASTIKPTFLQEIIDELS